MFFDLGHWNQPSTTADRSNRVGRLISEYPVVVQVRLRRHSRAYQGLDMPVSISSANLNGLTVAAPASFHCRELVAAGEAEWEACRRVFCEMLRLAERAKVDIVR